MKTVLESLRYPVICFSQNIVRVKRTENELSTCNRLALKNGWYRGMLIVDSSGTALRVKDARTLRGIGFFWGYGLLRSRRVIAELAVADPPSTKSVGDLKEVVLESFRKHHGWSSRGDFAELKLRIRKATTISEIIEILKD